MYLTGVLLVSLALLFLSIYISSSYSHYDIFTVACSL